MMAARACCFTLDERCEGILIVQGPAQLRTSQQFGIKRSKGMQESKRAKGGCLILRLELEQSILRPTIGASSVGHTNDPSLC